MISPSEREQIFKDGLRVARANLLGGVSTYSDVEAFWPSTAEFLNYVMDMAWEVGFEEGRKVGEEDAYDEGYEEGYSRGKYTGESLGLEYGYKDALQDVEDSIDNLRDEFDIRRGE